MVCYWLSVRPSVTMENFGVRSIAWTAVVANSSGSFNDVHGLAPGGDGQHCWDVSHIFADSRKQWESVTLAPAPGCRGKRIHVFYLEPKLRSLLSCPYQSVLFSSLLHLLFLVQVFNVVFFHSSIKIPTFVKFLANTFLMYRVQGTIDSVMEELIVQCRNHVSGLLNNLKGFNTSLALPCIKYHTCAAYHILLINDSLCVFYNTYN